MDMELLKRFCAVAEEGSITKAAQRIYMTQPALSKSISYLESRLKTKLFDRNGNGIILTTQGEKLYQYAKKVLQDHEIFEREFLEDKDKVQGELKIVTFPYTGAEWLVPLLKDFLELYPDIKIRMRLDAENITPHNTDVALGAFIPHQPHLVQKELFPTTAKLYASEEYLKKFGTPQIPEDLDHHRLISYRDKNYYSPYRSVNLLMNIGIKTFDPPRTPYFEVESLSGMINAAVNGYGIVELPSFPAILNSGLKVVLPKVRGRKNSLYYIFHENRKSSKKILVLYEYLMQKISEEKKR